MRTKLNRRKTFTSHYKSLCNHSSYSLMKLTLILYDDCPYMGDGYSCHGTCSNLLALVPSKGLKKHGLAILSEHAPSPYEIMEWPSHHLAQSNPVMSCPFTHSHVPSCRVQNQRSSLVHLSKAAFYWNTIHFSNIVYS